MQSSLRVIGIVIALSLTACGFQLRGSVQLPPHHLPVMVRAQQADSLQAAVTVWLHQQEITLTTETAAARFIVSLANERLERRVVAVATHGGALQEIELQLQAELSVDSVCAGQLLAPVPIEVMRNYTVKNTEVLAESLEEQLQRQEMLREAAIQVVRRLQILSQTPCASS